MIRTRIAPSPTGSMHIGTLRTALTSFLFARKNQGRFLIRLEDTDQTRFVPGATEELIRALKWAGLTWDEGIDFSDEPVALGANLAKKAANGIAAAKNAIQEKVIEKGNSGPYIQSKRLDIYQKHIQALLDKGQAYHCFCSAERLDTMRKEQMARREAPRYDKKCLHMPKSEVEERLRNKEPHVIRLRVPEEGVTEFNDLVRGKISIENKLVDDQVLIKSDGFPTYHFAVVVDDHLMKITHVLRGEEWISSTPKHILIYKAFEWELPEFGHLPQLLNLTGKKLSKRDGDVSVTDFIKKGYLPEAIINFIALLGWNPKTNQELFTMQELIDQFDLAKINKAGAKFDYNRLNWFNSHYLKQLSPEELFEKTKPYFIEYLETKAKEDAEFQGLTVADEKIKKIIEVQKERANTLADFPLNVDYLLKEKIVIESQMLPWKDQSLEAVKEKLKLAEETLAAISQDDWTLENLTEKLLAAAGDDRGSLLWPLRVALTGEKQSPSPFECAWILGKEESLERIGNCVK